MTKKYLFSALAALVILWIINPFIMPIELKANFDNNRARIDIYTQGNVKNSVKVNTEDKRVQILYPEWMKSISWIKNSGTGASINLKTASHNRIATFQLTSEGKGKLILKLMGTDYKKANKRIPVWINYEEVLINGQPISDLPIVVSHDKSYSITLDVQNGEKIDIVVKHKKAPLSQINGFYRFIITDIILFALLFSGFWYGYKNITEIKWDINKVFIGIMLPISLLYLWFLLVNENGYFSSGYGNHTYFCDFFEPITKALGLDSYSRGVQNPPLLNILYYLFGQTGDYVSKNSFDAFHQTGNYAKAHLFIFAMATFLLLSLFDKYKTDKPYKYALMFILIFSLPFSNAISTGNPMILSVALTTVYLLNYDNENARVREFALISLGIASGLKLYPCVFGLLTLYRGNFKETLRLVLYGLAFVFLPFLFFKGGLANVPLIIENISKYNTGMWNYFSFRYLIYANAGFDGVLRGDLTSLIGADYALLVDKFILGLNGILFILIFATNYFQKNEWKRINQLVLVILTIVNNRSYPYFGLYLFVCIVMFLNQAKLTKLNLAYLFLFVAILNPLKILNNEVLRAISAHLMLIILTVESTISFLKSDKTELKQIKLKLFSKGAKHV